MKIDSFLKIIISQWNDYGDTFCQLKHTSISISELYDLRSPAKLVYSGERREEPDGGRRSTVATWTRRRAAPAYPPYLTWPDLFATFTTVQEYCNKSVLINHRLFIYLPIVVYDIENPFCVQLALVGVYRRRWRRLVLVTTDQGNWCPQTFLISDSAFTAPS